LYNTDHYNPRHFNKIMSKDITLVKISDQAEKIRSEYNFYYMLPASLQRWFVQPYNFIISEESASYEMEKINKKNIGEMFANGEVDLTSFKKMMNLIETFKNECNELYLEQSDCIEESEYLVITKTKNRIKSSHNELLDRISKAYLHYRDERTVWNKTISHGDLCLSNILWIKEFNIIKFIDPRGAVSVKDIYMDEYYDLAKLSHSILGGYENILYNSKYKDKAVQDVFIDYLNRNNISINLLRVYEASLFLSMVPLHEENQKNVQGFLSKCDSILLELGF